MTQRNGSFEVPSERAAGLVASSVVSPEVAARPLAARATPPAMIRLPSARAAWRALSLADAPALLDLIHRCEDADRTPYRATAAEIEEMFDPARPHAGYGGFDEDGTLVAHGFVRLRHQAGDLVQALCSGAVDPAWRDRKIGTELVGWQVDVARHILATSGMEGPAQILHIADETHESMHEILSLNGFQKRRIYTQMRRDLSLPLVEIELGSNLTIEPWGPTWVEQVRRAYNTAHADAGVGATLSPEEWVREFSALVPEWSFVALDRSTDRTRVAGYLIGARYEDDWPMLGWREGYIESFAVMGEFRNRGVGRALLTRAMRAFKDSGMDYAGIDVDSEDDGSTNALYSGLKFEPTHRSALWTVDI